MGAFDAAPRSGGPGVQTANERQSTGNGRSFAASRLHGRPALQADRVECLCVSVALWLITSAT
jgi:hypothetical protein